MTGAKPFSLRELLARVHALLRRAQPAKTLIDELRVNNVVIDFRKYEATEAGPPLDLTRREFQLLRVSAQSYIVSEVPASAQITFTIGAEGKAQDAVYLASSWLKFELQQNFVERARYSVTSCGRICLYRKKINLSKSLAGQAVGVKEVDDGIWLVTFMDYDLGYIELEERTLQPLENPFGPKVLPMS